MSAGASPQGDNDDRENKPASTLKKILRLPGLIAIWTVKLVYQHGIGRCLPKVCIYEPSCSNYMIQAIETHGLIRGLLLGTWRICRCHPFAQGGWDPVPGREYQPEARPSPAEASDKRGK